MHEGAGGALAVRASDVDEFLTGGRQVQFAQQALHIVEPQLDAVELRAVEPVDFFLRRGVGHLDAIKCPQNGQETSATDRFPVSHRAVTAIMRVHVFDSRF
jgi:hypothetical protein